MAHRRRRPTVAASALRTAAAVITAPAMSMRFSVGRPVRNRTPGQRAPRRWWSPPVPTAMAHVGVEGQVPDRHAEQKPGLGQRLGNRDVRGIPVDLVPQVAAAQMPSRLGGRVSIETQGSDVAADGRIVDVGMEQDVVQQDAGIGVHQEQAMFCAGVRERPGRRAGPSSYLDLISRRAHEGTDEQDRISVRRRDVFRPNRGQEAQPEASPRIAGMNNAGAICRGLFFMGSPFHRVSSTLTDQIERAGRRDVSCPEWRPAPFRRR